MKLYLSSFWKKKIILIYHHPRLWELKFENYKINKSNYIPKLQIVINILWEIRKSFWITVRDKQQKFVFTNLSTVLYCSQCENKKFGKEEYRRREGKKFVAPLSSRGANRVYARNKAGIAKRHFETSHLRFQEVHRRRAPWKTGTVALPFNPFAPPASLSRDRNAIWSEQILNPGGARAFIASRFIPLFSVSLCTVFDEVDVDIVAFLSPLVKVFLG